MTYVYARVQAELVDSFLQARLPELIDRKVITRTADGWYVVLLDDSAAPESWEGRWVDYVIGMDLTKAWPSRLYVAGRSPYGPASWQDEHLITWSIR